METITIPRGRIARVIHYFTVPGGIGIIAAAGVPAAMLFIAVASLIVVLVSVSHSPSRRWEFSAGEWVLRAAGILLPVTVREECLEEWCSWLDDMRLAGDSRFRRLSEGSSILLGIPRRALIERLRRRRAVE